MYELQIYVEYTGFAAFLERSIGRPLSTRKNGEFRSIANKEAVLYWHRNFLPRHFSRAQRMYNNRERKPAYQDIKQKLASGQTLIINGRLVNEKVQKGGEIDAVRGGDTERQAEGAPTVVTNPNMAKLRFIVPRYAAIKPRDPSKPNLRFELTRTTAAERTQLRKEWMRSYKRSVNAYRETIRKTL